MQINLISRPDNCDGSYASNCDSSRDYTDITTILENAGKSSLLSYMNEYWISNDESNEDFWEHEWSKHGTCINTLDPSCYTNYQPGDEIPDFFQTTVDLFQTLPTYDVRLLSLQSYLLSVFSLHLLAMLLSRMRSFFLFQVTIFLPAGAQLPHPQMICSATLRNLGRMPSIMTSD